MCSLYMHNKVLPSELLKVGFGIYCVGRLKKRFFVSLFTVCGVDIVSLSVTKIKKDIT